MLQKKKGKAEETRGESDGWFELAHYFLLFALLALLLKLVFPRLLGTLLEQEYSDSPSTLLLPQELESTSKSASSSFAMGLLIKLELLL